MTLWKHRWIFFLIYIYEPQEKYAPERFLVSNRTFQIIIIFFKKEFGIVICDQGKGRFLDTITLKYLVNCHQFQGRNITTESNRSYTFFFNVVKQK